MRERQALSTKVAKEYSQPFLSRNVMHVFEVSGAFIVLLFFITSVHMKNAQAAPPTCLIRVIHAAPGIGTADVYIDGNKLLTNFPFGSVTPYQEVPLGTHVIEIRQVSNNKVMLHTSASLTTENAAITVAAVGTQRFDLAAIPDDTNAVSGQVKVRVYQFSPSLLAVDVSNQQRLLASSVAYKTASHYATIPTGVVTLTIQSGVQTLPPVSLQTTRDRIYSVFVIGQTQGLPRLSIVTTSNTATPNFPDTGAAPVATGSQNWFSGTNEAILMIVFCGACVLVSIRIENSKQGNASVATALLISRLAIIVGTAFTVYTALYH